MEASEPCPLSSSPDFLLRLISDKLPNTGVPVPVPVYVPVPMNMYSQYTPTPLLLPLPVRLPSTASLPFARFFSLQYIEVRS